MLIFVLTDVNLEGCQKTDKITTTIKLNTPHNKHSET